MRVCEDGQGFGDLKYCDLKPNDIFKWAWESTGESNNIILLKLVNGHTVLSGPYDNNYGKVYHYANDYIKVILYPDACIQLGDPK